MCRLLPGLSFLDGGSNFNRINLEQPQLLMNSQVNLAKKINKKQPRLRSETKHLNKELKNSAAMNELMLLHTSIRFQLNMCLAVTFIKTQNQP